MATGSGIGSTRWRRSALTCLAATCAFSIFSGCRQSRPMPSRRMSWSPGPGSARSATRSKPSQRSLPSTPISAQPRPSVPPLPPRRRGRRHWRRCGISSPFCPRPRRSLCSCGWPRVIRMSRASRARPSAIAWRQELLQPLRRAGPQVSSVRAPRLFVSLTRRRKPEARSPEAREGGRRGETAPGATRCAGAAWRAGGERDLRGRDREPSSRRLRCRRGAASRSAHHRGGTRHRRQRPSKAGGDPRAARCKATFRRAVGGFEDL